MGVAHHDDGALTLKRNRSIESGAPGRGPEDSEAPRLQIDGGGRHARRLQNRGEDIVGNFTLVEGAHATALKDRFQQRIVSQ